MPEAQRARLYDWFCEQTDAQLAEYAMSCLSPAPISDLATREDLYREVRRLDKAIEALGQRMDRMEARMETDRAQSRRQFTWLVGIVVALFVANTSVVLGAITAI